jgi:hypothetical protein
MIVKESSNLTAQSWIDDARRQASAIQDSRAALRAFLERVPPATEELVQLLQATGFCEGGLKDPAYQRIAELEKRVAALTAEKT